MQIDVVKCIFLNLLQYNLFATLFFSFFLYYAVLQILNHHDFKSFIVLLL